MTSPPTLEINLIPIDGYEKNDLKGLTSEYYLGMIKTNVDEELSLDPTPMQQIM